VPSGEVVDHAGGVASKYDSYWAGRLGEVRTAVESAVAGLPVVVTLPGLRSAGERHSWHGVAEVCGRGVMRSSMAHAASLGRVVAASGMCLAWPDQTFRFTIAAPGDTLTISAGMDHPAQRAGAAAFPPEQVPARSTAGASCSGPSGRGAGNALPSGRRAHVPDVTATGRFCQALDQLAENLGGPRCLRDCRVADGWPRQSVYFFFEPGEVRADGRDRVVRVGTHALTAASQATSWGRLRQHRGQVGGRHPGGGNHRASVFRRHIGAAIIQRGKLPPGLLDSWLDRHGPRPGQADQEARIEEAVSGYIGAMPFLWLAVGQRAVRGCVERNGIALTSCLADRLEPPWRASRRQPGEMDGIGSVEPKAGSPNPEANT